MPGARCVAAGRAERAEQERHLLAEQARAEERARLAGEMHDVVTHRVSLMVLQAGALSITAPDGATRQAAEELRAAGCQALDELRDLVGILRTAPGDDPAPTAGLALVAESAAVGGEAELVEDGDPALASPVVGRTVYRIAREALTNVRKHAPGARGGPGGLLPTQILVSVRNAAPPPSESPAGRQSAGRDGLRPGLANLRQRLELMHGSLRAARGRWRFQRRGHPARIYPHGRAGDIAVIRVVVVDDEPMVCAHLRTILGSAGDIEVVDTAHDGAAGVEAVCAAGPTWC